MAKIEGSPVFNFMKGLSPLKQVKSLPISQSYNNDLNFLASIPSIFSSPRPVSRRSWFISEPICVFDSPGETSDPDPAKDYAVPVHDDPSCNENISDVHPRKRKRPLDSPRPLSRRARFISEPILVFDSPAQLGDPAKDYADPSCYEIISDLHRGKRKRRLDFEDASQTSALVSNVGENIQACKRCTCIKSKCLKLYCECFAAGLYCVKPCSCRNCFNSPIHEDTILATRKQIKSRNSMAFAPKVTKSATPASALGDARHIRGCSCKKSSCKNKYCECYQGGVGCSTSCRCEACKNNFGPKQS